MTHHVDKGVDLVITQGLSALCALQLGDGGKRRGGPAHRLQHYVHGAAIPGTWITDIDPLALQILELLDIALLARHDSEWLRVEAKQATQLGVGSHSRKCAQPTKRGGLTIGLHDRQCYFLIPECLQIGNRAIGGLHRAAQPRFIGTLVDQPADCASCRVVNPCHAAGADGQRRGGQCPRRGHEGTQGHHGQRTRKRITHDHDWSLIGGSIIDTWPFTTTPGEIPSGLA